MKVPSSKLYNPDGMKLPIRSFVFALLCALFAFAVGQKPNAEATDSTIRFNLIQINDVYEITPVSKEGGMAKVATVYNSYKQVNPNTFMVIAGDFFSPSARPAHVC